MFKKKEDLTITGTNTHPAFFNKKKKKKEFLVNETVTDEAFIAFTHSSSFVGNVRYDDDTSEMRILLNEKAYTFCNVPQRTYDSFEGAGSKGAFFARNIKGQFDC